MQRQSWIGTMACVLIAFGGGYFAGNHGPVEGAGSSSPDAGLDSRAAVYFSPNGGCTDAVVAELNAARHDIELQGYTFTSRPIASALISAHHRGVHVTLVLDAVATSEHRAEAQFIIRAGIPVYLDSKHAIAHNKVILIDAHTLITGSFNFTTAAEEDHAENLLILHDQPRLQSAYEDNFRRHLEHSERFDER